jgi:hypothetical protein
LISKPYRYFIAASCLVLVWRVLALFLRDADEQSLSMAILLAALGVSFLVAGFFIFVRTQGTMPRLFIAYCVCNGLHWGGPIAFDNATLEIGFLLFYLLISGTLGETFLLHFALTFASKTGSISKKLLFAIYVPFLLSIALAVGVFFTSPESPLQNPFLITHLIVGNGYGAVVLLLLIISLFKKTGSNIGKGTIALMIASLLIAWLPEMIVSSLGGNNEPWLLTFVAIPIAFSIALTRARRTELA